MDAYLGLALLVAGQEAIAHTRLKTSGHGRPVFAQSRHRSLVELFTFSRILLRRDNFPPGFSPGSLEEAWSGF